MVAARLPLLGAVACAALAPVSATPAHGATRLPGALLPASLAAPQPRLVLTSVTDGRAAVLTLSGLRPSHVGREARLQRRQRTGWTTVTRRRIRSTRRLRFVRMLPAGTSAWRVALVTPPGAAGPSSVITRPLRVTRRRALPGASDPAALCLRSQGLPMRPLAAGTDDFFGTRGTRYANGGETISIYRYASEDAAGAVAAAISPDGSTITRGDRVVHADWIGPPHLFRSGAAIVFYVGADAATLRALTACFGGQFAGR